MNGSAKSRCSFGTKASIALIMETPYTERPLLIAIPPIAGELLLSSKRNARRPSGKEVQTAPSSR